LNHTGNKIIAGFELKIDDSLHLSGTAKLELLHAVNPFLKLTTDTNSFGSLMSGDLVCKNDGSVKIINSNPAKSELSVVLKSKNPPQQVAGYFSFELPEMKNGFESFHISYLDIERIDPYVLPFNIEEEYQISIEIPEGYEFVSKKVKTGVKNKTGSATITMSPKGNQMKVTRELHLNNKVIRVSEYNDFREVVNAWLDENLRKVVFKKAVD
jgi:pyruvate carboxylase